MLSSDAAAVTAARLRPLGFPVLVTPNLYGTGGVRDLDWHVLNHPQGWLVVLRPLSLGTQEYLAHWSIQIEAVAKTEAAAAQVARQVQDTLLHTSRRPTGFEFMGDTSAGTSGVAFKYTLSFTAHLRQGEETWL